MPRNCRHIGKEIIASKKQGRIYGTKIGCFSYASKTMASTALNCLSIVLQNIHGKNPNK